MNDNCRLTAAQNKLDFETAIPHAKEIERGLNRLEEKLDAPCTLGVSMLGRDIYTESETVTQKFIAGLELATEYTDSKLEEEKHVVAATKHNYEVVDQYITQMAGEIHNTEETLAAEYPEYEHYRPDDSNQNESIQSCSSSTANQSLLYKETPKCGSKYSLLQDLKRDVLGDTSNLDRSPDTMESIESHSFSSIFGAQYISSVSKRGKKCGMLGAASSGVKGQTNVLIRDPRDDRENHHPNKPLINYDAILPKNNEKLILPVEPGLSHLSRRLLGEKN